MVPTEEAAFAPLAQVRRDRVARPPVPVARLVARRVPVGRAVDVPLVAVRRVPVAVRGAPVAVVRVVPAARTVAPVAVRGAPAAVVSALEETGIVAATGEERLERPQAPDQGQPLRQSQLDLSRFPSRW